MTTRVEIEPLRPAVDGAKWAAISPEQQRLAYTLANAGGFADLWLAPLGGDEMKLVEGKDFIPLRPSWSPNGEHLAYLVGSKTPHGGGQQVGVCNSRGEIARIPGYACAWKPDDSLVIASVDTQALLEVSPEGEVLRKLAPLHDDGDPHFPPVLAVSDDGLRIAYTCRHVDHGLTELFVVDGRRHWRNEMLTEIPGAGARVAPFWSPDGDSLAFLLVHLEEDMSAIVLVDKLEGEGEVVYESPLLDLPEAPVWLPQRRELIFFRTPRPEHEYTAAGPVALTLLQLDGGAQEALTEPGDIEGRLRLIDARTIAIDAVGAAYRVRLARA